MKKIKVTFICKHCMTISSSEMSFLELPENKYQIKKELEMYKPFACPLCGSDEFWLDEYEEIEVKKS